MQCNLAVGLMQRNEAITINRICWNWAGNRPMRILMVSTLKQGLGYGLVGGVQLALDWLTFVTLTTLGVPVGGANVAGRATAAALGFWLNGKWTFGKSNESALGIDHFGRYLVLWTSMALLSTFVVMVATRIDGVHVAWLIKPVADLFLAAVGFVVSKYWIYR